MMTRRTFVLALLMVRVLLTPRSLAATVITPYTSVTIDYTGPCGEGLNHSSWIYDIQAYDSEWNWVGEDQFSESQVTDNIDIDGTVTMPLAGLKAQVGSADVHLIGYVTDTCQTSESTVAILCSGDGPSDAAGRSYARTVRLNRPPVRFWRRLVHWR